MSGLTSARDAALPADNAPGMGRRRRFWRDPSATEITVVLLLTILVLFGMVYPAIYIFYGSVKVAGGVLADTAGFTFENYVRIFQSGFGQFVVNSLFICITATLISTAVSVSAAYAFSRFVFRGKRLLFGAILFGQMFPWIVLVNPLFVLFARGGLTNSYAGMIFCYVAISIPFSVYMLTGYLATVPKDLDEAAIIDGASRLQIVWRIIFPVMMPGIVATATYAFLLCWTEYLFALAFLTKPDMKTLPLGLYQFFGDDSVDWGAVMAASAVTTLPTLILFLPLQSKLSAGLTAGAVK
ncbi:carbohydrate ABC transporter permease [Geminicoccus roseus]|uniref:carbohydrate ABC transporter permease n=1 Tax=Geminicoccus roseus TaxID=404900 RepID=UPI0006881CA1|nr:carbohydrate ABC transporter permease [Geminicoccus roseus]